MEFKAKERAKLRSAQRDEHRTRWRAEKELKELVDGLAYHGIKLTYTLEDVQPTVRRKSGYRMHRFDWSRKRCPNCRAGSRIYYLFTEIQPWRKVTDYQCGFCGHEWKEVDNTYD